MFRGRLAVTLYVHDLSASVDYYRWGLGFAFDGYWSAEAGHLPDNWEEAGMPAYAEVRAGDNVIGLQRADDVAMTFRAELRLEVIDIEGYHHHVKEAGAEPGDIVTHEDNWKAFTVNDPNGYVWQFYKPLRFGS
jgi:hypothetical protein